MKRSYPKFQQRLEEAGLREELETAAKKAHVSLQTLYDGPGSAPSVRAARKAIYGWLMRKRGLGNNEVARLFNRAPSGVAKLVHGKDE